MCVNAVSGCERDYEFNRKRHQERLAQLSSGVATIHAGGRTQTELWERKLRLEDAVHAAQAAQLEGVVPGGGTALVRLIPTIKSCADALRGDEKTGALAVIHALEAPVWQIAEKPVGTEAQSRQSCAVCRRP